MSLSVTRTKDGKSSQVTLGEAREAARAVKGKRLTSKARKISAKKYKALHERYLGEIVHSGRSNAPRKSPDGSIESAQRVRTPAKKK